MKNPGARFIVGLFSMLLSFAAEAQLTTNQPLSSEIRGNIFKTNGGLIDRTNMCLIVDVNYTKYGDCVASMNVLGLSGIVSGKKAKTHQYLDTDGLGLNTLGKIVLAPLYLGYEAYKSVSCGNKGNSYLNELKEANLLCSQHNISDTGSFVDDRSVFEQYYGFRRYNNERYNNEPYDTDEDELEE